MFVAGATFNIVLALLVMWLALWLYGKQEVKIAETAPVVARVLDGSTAQAAGIRQGDRVLEIAGRDARDPNADRLLGEAIRDSGRVILPVDKNVVEGGMIGVALPAAPFAAAAAKLAHIDSELDPDGIFRSTFLLL